MTNLYNYLDKHRDHIDYAKFKELELPIGSGIVESACKWLIQQRFKKASVAKKRGTTKGRNVSIQYN